MWRRVLGPWNAAALPEIWPGPCRKASPMCLSSAQKAKQQASNMVALPENEEVEQQKPERGLTLRLTGAPKARPS